MSSKRITMKTVDEIAKKIYNKEDIEWSQALKKALKIHKENEEKKKSSVRKRYSKKSSSDRREKRKMKMKTIKKKSPIIKKSKSPVNKKSK